LFGQNPNICAAIILSHQCPTWKFVLVSQWTKELLPLPILKLHAGILASGPHDTEQQNRQNVFVPLTWLCLDFQFFVCCAIYELAREICWLS